jgi:hypothetical protein
MEAVRVALATAPTANATNIVYEEDKNADQLNLAGPLHLQN